jgi:hypothetical protein
MPVLEPTNNFPPSNQLDEPNQDLSTIGTSPIGGNPLGQELAPRGDTVDWVGGKPIDLERTMESGKTLKEELSAHLCETLDKEMENHVKYIKKIERWNKIYKADKRGNRPQEWMADVSIPIARCNADAIRVRIMDMLFNKRKIALMNPRGQVDGEMRDKYVAWEKAFNHYLLKELKLKEKLKFPISQTVNIGTGVVKIVYETKNRPIYRYAKEEDIANPETLKYQPTNGSPLVKENSIVFKGPNVYPINRADLIISSDATNIDDAYIVGFRFYRRKKQLQTMAKNALYLQDAVDKLTSTDYDDIKKASASASGKELGTTKYTEPYELWEIWFKYDVDDDGEEDDIVVTINRQSKQIVKAIYNPIFYGYRPFVDFKGASQVEYTYDGEGVCELVDVICEEIDTLQDLHLDRMKLINLGYIFYNSGAFNDENGFKLIPGRPTPTDGNPQDSVYFPNMPSVQFAIENTVQWLIGQADRVCGITQSSLGISTAERPVAKDTMALQEESNKKFKAWADNIRDGILEMLYKILESMAQHQPEYTYTDESGATQSVLMPMGNIRELIDVQLEVSSETMNQEINRQRELMKYQLITEYMTSMAQMAQALSSQETPSEFKKFILSVVGPADATFKRILQNFDETDQDQLIPPITQTMDTGKCMAESADLIQERQQQEMANNPELVQAMAGAQGQQQGQQTA